MNFPYYKQHDSMDCGPTCLRMIAKYYGKSMSLQHLRQKCQIQRNGVSMLGISHAWLADPGKGLVRLARKDFECKWISTRQNDEQLGVVLLLEPSASFTGTDDATPNKRLNAAHLLNHFKKHKRLFVQLTLGILIGILLQAVLPFLTQSVVDVGIASKDINFITLVLIGQIMIFVGSTVIDFIRSWILLHISTRINISLLTEFFIKLMKLPISYFDIKLTGDIMQRMGDHSRIQSFLTTTLLNTSFSIINFVVFTFMAIAYDMQLFFIFLAGSLLYLGWITLFLRHERIWISSGSICLHPIRTLQ